MHVRQEEEAAMAQLLLTFHHASDAAAARAMASSRTLQNKRAPTLRAVLEALSMSGWPLPVNSTALLGARHQSILERVAYCHAHGCAPPHLCCTATFKTPVTPQRSWHAKLQHMVLIKLGLFLNLQSASSAADKRRPRLEVLGHAH